MKQKPVKKNICEVVKLFPGAPQMEKPSTVIKKNAIKSYACGHSERKKDEKSCGNKPGIKNKHPQAQFFGHEND
jgi:hypothetical protein